MLNSQHMIGPKFPCFLLISALPPLIDSLSHVAPYPPPQVTWLNPIESNHSIHWDSLMCASGSETKTLFEKACKDSLSPPEQSFLSLAFDSDQRLVHSIGLTPAKVLAMTATS